MKKVPRPECIALCDQRIFVAYYGDAVAADSVEQIEDTCKQWLDERFEDEQIREDGDGWYLMYLTAKETEPGELVEALAHDNKWVRGLACKRYVHLTQDWKYKTWFIDTWNYIYCYNAETHGTVMAGCFKSDKEELHALGHRVWNDLEEMHKGQIHFDT